jgi:hypothetical protein
MPFYYVKMNTAVTTENEQDEEQFLETPQEASDEIPAKRLWKKVRDVIKEIVAREKPKCDVLLE